MSNLSVKEACADVPGYYKVTIPHAKERGKRLGVRYKSYQRRVMFAHWASFNLALLVNTYMMATMTTYFLVNIDAFGAAQTLMTALSVVVVLSQILLMTALSYRGHQLQESKHFFLIFVTIRKNMNIARVVASFLIGSALTVIGFVIIFNTNNFVLNFILSLAITCGILLIIAGITLSLMLTDESLYAIFRYHVGFGEYDATVIRYLLVDFKDSPSAVALLMRKHHLRIRRDIGPKRQLQPKPVKGVVGLRRTVGTSTLTRRRAIQALDHDLSSSTSSESKKCAQMSFIKKNNVGNVRQLQIKAIRGVNLAAKDDNGLSDPYLKISVGTVKVKTKVCKRTLNPMWNQTLLLDVPVHAKPHVEISCYDWDRLLHGHDDLIGTYRCMLKDLTLNKAVTLQLSPPPNDKSGDLPGSIEIEASWISNNGISTEELSTEELNMREVNKKTLGLPPAKKERLSIDAVFKPVQVSARKLVYISDTSESSSSESGAVVKVSSDEDSDDDGEAQLSEVTSLDNVSSSLD